MYSLRLTCTSQEVDYLSAELWEAGTAGICEIPDGNGKVTLIAGFEGQPCKDLLEQFARYAPHWVPEAETDWVAATEQAWPGRAVGTRLFLAAPWCSTATPAARKRVVHNPGMASGTGEHACTQLALEALEKLVTPLSKVADIGTGSGILALAARLLGAPAALGIDLDESALQIARENFGLNDLQIDLVAGSVDCIRAESFSIVVANINATVLLSVADDLLGIVRPNGWFILTGFGNTELTTIKEIFPAHEIRERDGWCCLISRSS